VDETSEEEEEAVIIGNEGEIKRTQRERYEKFLTAFNKDPYKRMERVRNVRKLRPILRKSGYSHLAR